LRKRITYRILATYSLVAILAIPLGIQAWHNWSEEHRPQVHCDSEHGQIHIHDHTYAFDHCYLCTFHFSQYTGQLEIVQSQVPGWNLEAPLAIDQLLLPRRIFSNRSSRAPPAVRA
jgi:hypothetical protein